MTTGDSIPEDQRSALRVRWYVAVTVVVLAAILVYNAVATEPTPQSRSVNACLRFRRVVDGATSGSLTGTALAAELKTVSQDAFAATPEVQAASARMLRGATTNSDKEFNDGAAQMTAACSAVGH